MNPEQHYAEYTVGLFVAALRGRGLGREVTWLVAALERDWPDYQIWVVHRAVSQPRILWCAKRWDWQPGGTVLNADSAEELAEALAEAEQ